MGISGLLKCLESITTREHLREYRNMVAGVDASNWLYQGAYSCSAEIAQDIKTTKYVTYCLNRVELLQKFEVTPILVFDGAPLPMKAAKHEERRRKRRHNRELGLAALAAGDSAVARKYFNQALHVTAEMAHALIEALRKRGVKFLVSPYEADAQLAFLCHSNLIDIIISEDSDTLPFGCSKILFKLDNEGNVEVIERRNLGANQGLSFLNWTHEMFLDMCLLAGCDYLPAVAGVGIKTAHKMVKHYKKPDKIIEAVEKAGYKLSENYRELFLKARLTFLHQKVFDPIREELTILNASDFQTVDGIDDYSFLGPEKEKEVILDIVSGNIHPSKHISFANANEGLFQLQEDAAEEASHQFNDSLPCDDHLMSHLQFKGDVGNTNQSTIIGNISSPTPTEKNVLHLGSETNSLTAPLMRRNSSGRDLFSFFSRYSSNIRHVQNDVDCSEPVDNFDLNDSQGVLSNQLVPIEAEDFCSTNISKNFETLHRRKRKRGKDTMALPTIHSYLKQLSQQRKTCGLESPCNDKSPKNKSSSPSSFPLQSDKNDFWSSFAHKRLLRQYSGSENTQSTNCETDQFAHSESDSLQGQTVLRNDANDGLDLQSKNTAGTVRTIPESKFEDSESLFIHDTLWDEYDQNPFDASHKDRNAALKFSSKNEDYTGNVEERPRSRGGLARFQVRHTKESWKGAHEEFNFEEKGEVYWDKKLGLH